MLILTKSRVIENEELISPEEISQKSLMTHEIVEPWLRESKKNQKNSSFQNSLIWLQVSRWFFMYFMGRQAPGRTFINNIYKLNIHAVNWKLDEIQKVNSICCCRIIQLHSMTYDFPFVCFIMCSTICTGMDFKIVAFILCLYIEDKFITYDSDCMSPTVWLRFYFVGKKKSIFTESTKTKIIFGNAIKKKINSLAGKYLGAHWRTNVFDEFGRKSKCWWTYTCLQSVG